MTVVAATATTVVLERPEGDSVSVRRAVGPMGGPADMPRARVTLEAEANSLYRPRRHRRPRRRYTTHSLGTAVQNSIPSFQCVNCQIFVCLMPAITNSSTKTHAFTIPFPIKSPQMNNLSNYKLYSNFAHLKYRRAPF